MEGVLTFLSGLPPPLIHVVLGLGAAIENILPVVPADTFVVVGGFVAGLGAVRAVPVFLFVWGFNVAGAMAVYAVGRRYGPRFFSEGPGRHLLAPEQMDRLETFYARWGVVAIFVGRFLPGFRALVPVFAGVTGLGTVRVLPPLAVASAVWYGTLVRVGYLAGDNLEAVVEAIERANRGLLVASAVLAALILGFWWRARRRGAEPGGHGQDAG
ncbi:MAG: DedA family protein [Gemmatimonadota bacterium]|nr:DedA family protein [Gemmatimonadota bacterium]MDE2871314.1 DedA family protein [Gemmatimonadota bacterium]